MKILSTCSDLFDVVLPKTMMPLPYSIPAPEPPRRTRLSVHARRLVIALVLIIVAVSADGQTPVFIQDFAYAAEGEASGITTVACGKDRTTTHGTPCVAKIGDVVSL